MSAWALVVGINEYRPESGLSTLFGAVDDAVDFAEWALDPAGGAIEPAGLHLWTWPMPAAPSKAVEDALAAPPDWAHGPPDFTRAPRGDEIRLTLFNLAQKAAAEGVERLYVYFAGHGLQTKPLQYQLPEQVCFVAGDYLPLFTQSLVPGIYVRSLMRRLGPVEVLMFFDCCRDEMSSFQADPPVEWPTFNGAGTNLCCSLGLAASPGAKAFETPTASPKRGAFTRLLTYGLRALREKDVLTPGLLQIYLRTGIDRLTKPHRQKPSIILEPDDYDLELVRGPPTVAPPDLKVDLSQRPAQQDVIMIYPDRSQVTLEAQAVHAFPAAPIGLYFFETPAHVALHSEYHSGPDPTDVAIA